ncbi:response regulator transcription factor [Micromonospora endolithica]|uniref:DNA-binding response regulator n=1 Tax=Micromonospora endolithica TaxID=230091 RepID=A0A3A9ZGX6_9ACTN|nr:response regulator transcription factor [Micromonospora endolithica]RKN47618.1 DNA-binding response regulator [Micromonospora endolithica]TWJ21275.1 two component transcriptional regulator, LuxR family [Micromonospora endolithica]
MPEPVRVLIVDDHPVVRRGLRTMLDGESWVAQVWEAASCAEALATVTAHQVDVVAMDIALPDGDGVRATAQILRHRPRIAVLMLTMADDDELVARALQAGARGYLLKDTDPDVVVDALRTAAFGGLVLGPGVRLPGTTAPPGRLPPPAALPPPFDQLTPREQEILRHLAAGEGNAEIARRFGISAKTVRNQVSAVFAKLGVGDRVRAALLARDAGIVTPVAGRLQPDARHGSSQ